jgi:outer membrane protein assembly factor BamB
MKVAVLAAVTTLVAVPAFAQDWPQWRGPNRDARVAGFVAPETWPEKLAQKWKVAVGDGVATPALVDGKLYVFARESGNEVIRCLNAETGEEIWQEKSPSAGVGGGAGGFPGPRSSPAVADGKVVLMGVHGVLSCRNAADGKELWRVTKYEGDEPRFSTSSSPIIVDGLVIAQLGGDRNGVIIAYDLTTGEEKWKLEGAPPAYGSPALITVDGVKAIVTPTENKMIAVNAADGKRLWEISYTQGRYNAASPMVDEQTLVFAGPTRGITAVKLEKKDAELAASDAWKNGDNSVQFNTPVIRDDLLFGLSNLGSVFCIKTKTGETAWNAPLSGAAAPRPGGERPDGERPGRRRGGRRGGGSGYGSVVDAGTAVFALTPNGQLVVFAPTGEEFKQLAKYQVAERGTYAYPIVAGKRIYIKDQNSVTLWSLE